MEVTINKTKYYGWSKYVIAILGWIALIDIIAMCIVVLLYRNFIGGLILFALIGTFFIKDDETLTYRFYKDMKRIFMHGG